MRKKKGLSFATPKKKLDIPILRSKLLFVLELMLVAAAAYIFVLAYGVQIEAMGSSMAPQIEDADILLCDRLVYAIKNPSRGDIIAFYPNGNEKTHLYIKRVVGLPGDEVRIADGVCYVNGEIYSNKYMNTVIEDGGLASDGVLLGEDEYFVLSDHPAGSEDSRYTSIGYVKKAYIYGKLWMRVTSAETIKLIK